MKEAAKETSTAQNFQSKQLSNEDRWRLCTLSGTELNEPIVGDALGNLYNKEAIINWLLDKSQFSKGQKELVKHITSLKDVVDVHPKYDNSSKDPVWICPLSQKDVIKESLSTKFVYIVPCGHVFSKNAITELDEPTCSECEHKYLNRDIIVINGEPGDIEMLKNRLVELEKEGLTHSLKKKVMVKRKAAKGAKNDSQSQVRVKKVKSSS